MNNGKAEAETSMYSRRARICLTKAIENMRQEIFTDSHARIAHDDLHVRIDALQHDLYATAFRRELHRVSQQVPDNLLQPIGVAGNWTSCRIQYRLQPNTLGVSRWPNRIDRSVDNGNQIDRPHVESQLSGNDARHVKEVRNELGL